MTQKQPAKIIVQMGMRENNVQLVVSSSSIAPHFCCKANISFGQIIYFYHYPAAEI
jgi:hypothetical protein